VFDLFRKDERHYLVMEYIEARTLESLGRQTQEQVLPWLFQLLDVLEFLHNQAPPIIYRDLRPSTICVTPQGQIKLTDFGIAKMLDPIRQGRTLFRAVGSPEFSPPESFGTQRSDARTDIYSLGATVYYTLCGDPPPQAADRIIREAPLLDLRQVNPSVSEPLAIAVVRMMAVKPTDRPASMAQVRELLADLAPAQAPPPVIAAPPAGVAAPPAGVATPLPVPVPERLPAQVPGGVLPRAGIRPAPPVSVLNLLRLPGARDWLILWTLLVLLVGFLSGLGLAENWL
ncbi:MAG TPA: serine/threonine-protein kinase, partial [Candidatus Xenobia bacterium]